MKVNANPTKQFFISMLTRDIPLDRSILDLVDNSVDSANEKQILGTGVIKISMSEERFIIEDNCGGFSRSDAINFAFRFGRDPTDNRDTPHSVGQFGVGMKRTLFKLGDNFVVKSICGEEGFSLSVDVADWLSSNDWTFDLEDLPIGEGSQGVRVEVTSLKKSVSEQFIENGFINNLIHQISKAHFKAISSGLKILVNNKKVDSFDISILSSSDLGVAVKTGVYDGVVVSVKAGVGERNLDAGGWYIVCNGRLVEAAEQSEKTLWDTNGIPKYHDRFAFFRGVVEFDCEDSSKLPWTTTKTGVDIDSPVFRYANKLMIQAMKPITTFLSQRERERKEVKDGRIDNQTLNLAIENASSSNIFTLPEEEQVFTSPSKEDARPLEVVNVSYQVKSEEIEKAKDLLGVSSASEVGKKTFEYYMNYESE